MNSMMKPDTTPQPSPGSPSSPSSTSSTSSPPESTVLTESPTPSAPASSAAPTGPETRPGDVGDTSDASGTVGNAIKVSAVCKAFGRKQVLTNMSFTIPRGTVAGFLGPNGAGKTTTLRILMGLVPPDSGTTELLGQNMPYGRVRALEQTGSLVERPSFIESLTGYENLAWFGSLTAPVSNQRLLEVLGRVGLLEAAHRNFGIYSTGMKQRLGVAFAILHHPTLLILDEPTNGMDPQGRVQMRDILREIHHAEGTTVFLSSHLLDEIQRLCDYVVIVDQGRMIREGYVGAILQTEHETWELRVTDEHVEKTRKALKDCAQVIDLQPAPRGLILLLTPGCSAQINNLLVSQNIPVTALIPQEASLEETFLQLTAENGKEQLS